jgi:subtilisin family serine protease
LRNCDMSWLSKAISLSCLFYGAHAGYGTVIAVHRAGQASAANLVSSEAVLTNTVTLGEYGFSIYDNITDPMALQDNENVQFFLDRPVYLEEDIWGLDRINQPSLPLDNNVNMGTNTGEGVDVYIIDTGIKTDHPDFEGRAIFGMNFNADGRTVDCHGHGTHVAGTVMSKTYGVAKQARAVALRVFDCNGGGGFLSTIISAIQYAVEQKKLTKRPSVINMSLGGGKSTPLNQAVAGAFSEGVVSAVAAGNDNNDACLYSPASEPSALTVAASTRVDSRASFSNYGSCADLLAPGQAILSTWITSATAVLSGTSMASPHVAGVAAQVLGENPVFTPAQLRDRVLELAAKEKLTNLRGSPNLLLQYAPPAQITCLPADERNGHQYCDKLDPTKFYFCSWGIRYTMATALGTKCTQVGTNVRLDAL